MSHVEVKNKSSKWIDDNISNYSALTSAACGILKNLLRKEGVDYLAVTGRTKDKKSCLEKIERKGYKDVRQQMTDLSGVRVIVFFESDVEKVCRIIDSSFTVDKENSGDKKKILSKDKIGYRSVHYVCDLGGARCKLPEFDGMDGLKFEIQVRTVLQHAWAELAHDRGYKFSESLPEDLERKLYLYSGMLEIADNGFDELSKKIDEYKETLGSSNLSEYVHESINSLALEVFFDKWCKENGVLAKYVRNAKSSLVDLVEELSFLGIHSIGDLQGIIPEWYAKSYNDYVREHGDSISTIYGIVRDWMINYNCEDLFSGYDLKWVLDDDTMRMIRGVLGDDKADEVLEASMKYGVYEE